jgi:hypothetical protein
MIGRKFLRLNCGAMMMSIQKLRSKSNKMLWSSRPIISMSQRVHLQLSRTITHTS